jgi:hypothetical protein
MDARELRHALAAIAHVMNQQVQDWQRLGEDEHLAAAQRALLDERDLAAACAAMLMALELHERARVATHDQQFAVDELRSRMDARRAR